jgi:hypothetical protein
MSVCKTWNAYISYSTQIYSYVRQWFNWLFIYWKHNGRTSIKFNGLQAVSKQQGGLQVIPNYGMVWPPRNEYYL